MSVAETPLSHWHKARGGRMVPFAGWLMPVQYAGVLPEHAAVRQGAGLFDISHMGRLRFRGAGALAFVETLVTNAVGALAVGQVRYALACNGAGGIRDDVLVTHEGPGAVGVVVNASNRAKLIPWFASRPGAAAVTFEDETEATAMLAVQGPKAVALCEGLIDPEPAGLKYYTSRPGRYRGEPCRVSRTGYTGEDGYEIVVPAKLAETLADELVRRGAVPCGLGARDILRLEAGMPLYGQELGEEIDPYSAGLGWAVKLGKGEFTGRAALMAMQAGAPERVRVGLRLAGSRAARTGSAVVGAGGEPLGAVTSGSFSPTLGAAIAMTYVPPTYVAPGTAVAVEVGGARLPAVVAELPFYRRAK